MSVNETSLGLFKKRFVKSNLPRQCEIWKTDSPGEQRGCALDDEHKLLQNRMCKYNEKLKDRT